MPVLVRRPDVLRRPRFDSGRIRAAVVGFVQGLTYSVAASLAMGGLDVEVWTAEENSSMRRSRRIDAMHVVPSEFGTRPDARFSDWLAPRLAERSIDVVVPADYDSFIWLSEARDQLSPVVSFPVPNRSIIEFYNDKGRVADACTRSGIDTPRTSRIDHRDALSALDQCGPIVVKPPDTGDSYGVYRLDSVGDLAGHLDADDRPGNALPLLVQEYIPGRDLDVTVVTRVGEVVQAVVSEHLPGSRGLRYLDHPRAVELAHAVSRLAAYDGVLDFDMRDDPVSGRLVVVDTNPRLTGSTLVKTWAGANLPLTGVRLALGLPIHHRTAIGEHHPIDHGLPAQLLRRGWTGDLAPTRAGLRSAMADLGWYLAR